MANKCVFASLLLLLGVAQGIQITTVKSLLRAGHVPARKAATKIPESTALTASADSAFAVALENDLLAGMGLVKDGLKKVKVDPEKLAAADQGKLKEAFTTQCTDKLEDLFDKYYERAQYQGPEGEYQMGHTLATHFAYNCNHSYPIDPVKCNALSTSLQNLVNDHKPLVIPNVTVNGTQIAEGACLEANKTVENVHVVKGKRLVIYDVNVSKCFGDVVVHYASPDPSLNTPFQAMNAEEGSPVHTYVAVVLPLEQVNDYSTRIGQCAKPPAKGLSTWNLTFSVAAVHRANGTCPEGAAFLQVHQDPPPPPSLEKADAEAPVYNNGEEWCGAFFDEYSKALQAEKK